MWEEKNVRATRYEKMLSSRHDPSTAIRNRHKMQSFALDLHKNWQFNKIELVRV